MNQRVRDWQSRLADCLAERMRRPFVWGQQDCVLFAADCVEAVLGEDPAADVRGTYSTARGASRVLRQRGGLAAIAAAALGSEIAPQLAQPGDVGLLSNAGQPCLGVWGGGAWYAPGADGLTSFPLESATRAWRVSRAKEA